MTSDGFEGTHRRSHRATYVNLWAPDLGRFHFSTPDILRSSNVLQQLLLQQHQKRCTELGGAPSVERLCRPDAKDDLYRSNVVCKSTKTSSNPKSGRWCNNKLSLAKTVQGKALKTGRVSRLKIRYLNMINNLDNCENRFSAQCDHRTRRSRYIMVSINTLYY